MLLIATNVKSVELELTYAELRMIRKALDAYDPTDYDECTSHDIITHRNIKNDVIKLLEGK